MRESPGENNWGFWTAIEWSFLTEFYNWLLKTVENTLSKNFEFQNNCAVLDDVAQLTVSLIELKLESPLENLRQFLFQFS